MKTSRTDRPAARAAALLLCLVLALAATAAGAGEMRLTGRVVDSDTQQPVAGAVVELANAGGGQGYFRARSDARGAFALERIPGGRWYALTVSADGFADFVVGSWEFPTAQRSADVVVPLERAGAIEVRLAGSDGKVPVANAKVEVRPERSAEWWEGYRPPPAPVFTDAQGVARFAGLTRGYWTASAEAPGLMSFEARRVAVRRGETTPVTAKLAQPASVSGTVRLTDGTPVAGVTVTARGAAEAVGTSGSDGSFTVTGLPPGRFRVEVAHEGFEPAALKEPVVLREGESRDGFALTVAPKPPELALVLEREAFALEAPVMVGLRSFRVGVADFTVFEIPVERLLGGPDFRALAQGADTAGLVRVAAWSRATAEGAPWAWREELVPVEGTLLPGAYVLSARAGALERRAIFFVTDLSLLVKRSAMQALVSAAALKSGRPVAGVTVLAVRGPTAVAPATEWGVAVEGGRRAGAPRAVTDERGLARFQPPAFADPSTVRFVGVSASNGIAVVEAPVAGVATRSAQIFVYTDRPIYRPGQIVNWKAFVRRGPGAAGGYALPDSGSIALAFAGPDGATIEVPPAHLGARGSADGAVTLPYEVALGDWTLTVTSGSTSGTAAVSIQEYRKPEFSVEVTPDRDVYVNGDEVRFRVAASYFFGAPVFGATVRYNLFESRLDRGEGGDFEDEESAGYGRVLSSGEARTDLDGRVALPFAPARAAYDRRLTLEVEVLDPAGRHVAGRGSAVMGRGTFALAVAPQRQVVTAGEEIGVVVTARDHSGRPVRAAVKVTLDQDAWNPLERRYERSTRPLAEAPVTTDSLGRGFVALHPALARSGRLDVRARAEDPRGNVITAAGSVWVYDARVPSYAYRYPTLEAYADRDSYAVGDTIRVLVNTDVRGATVLAALEGRELFDAQVVTLAGNTGLVRFPVRAECAPNAFVTVHVRQGREVRSRTLEVAIAAQRHDLKLALAFDRAEYRPGEAAQVAVRATDGRGAPVEAELSLGVVDEAIYSIRADATPDPHDVFYGRRPDAVTTVASFPALYYGGADKGGRGDVRRDFRDVALWAPTVLTGADGRAMVTLKWPDNLTTWRVTGRGATADTRVGAAVAKARVSKPLVARLAVPRALVAGDEVTLVSVATNRTAAPLAGVKQTLTVRGGPVRLTGPGERRADLPANGEARAEWPLVARAPDAAADSVPGAVLELRAGARDGGDALEQRVPVEPRAVPLSAAGAGVLEQAQETVAVPLPRDLVRAGSEVEIAVSPSPAGLALRAIHWLGDFPYGCTEQSASAIRAGATALMVMRHLGVTPPGFAAAAGRLQPAVDRLIALQQPDGGWGWWREADADPYLTALALDALARARGAGLGGDAAAMAIARGRPALLRLAAQVRSSDGEAYVLAHAAWLLAKGPAPAPGQPDLAAADDGLRSRLEDLALAVSGARDRLSDAGLALGALGQLGLGRAAEAKELTDALLARAQRDPVGLHWRGSADGWFGDDIEVTADALAAVLAVAPSDPRAAEAMLYLARRCEGDHWGSTRATAPVAIALLGWLAAHPGEARPDERVSVQWNGRTVLEQAFTDPWSAGARVRVAGSKLEPGDGNRIALARTGSGALYWSWRARALVPSPGPPATDTRLTLTREYLRAERTADRRGRPRWLSTPLEAGGALHVGEAVMVRLTLHATEALDHLMIEDPRPAGFEVDELVPDGAEHPWDVHGEARDTRSLFFLERVDEGDTVIEYLVRPELAGRLVALPASAGGMYRSGPPARSAEAVVPVAEGGKR
jgi:alpha-2-macroglobulin